MKIQYSYKAQGDFGTLSKDIQKRIAKKMRFYELQKDPLKFAQRLTDPREGQFRFRIGDWRLIFDVKDDAIFILRIKHRSRAY